VVVPAPPTLGAGAALGPEPEPGAGVARDGHYSFTYRYRHRRTGRCRHDGIRRFRSSTERVRLRGVSRVRGLVVPSTTMCGVRPHRVLRQLTQPARNRACELVRSLDHPELRARRGLVLGLPDQRVSRRTSPRTPAASSPRPTRARTSRTGAGQLAGSLGGIDMIRGASPRRIGPSASVCSRRRS
jgi:hypothetical protein